MYIKPSYFTRTVLFILKGITEAGDPNVIYQLPKCCSMFPLFLPLPLNVNRINKFTRFSVDCMHIDIKDTCTCHAFASKYDTYKETSKNTCIYFRIGSSNI